MNGLIYTTLVATIVASVGCSADIKLLLASDDQLQPQIQRDLKYIADTTAMPSDTKIVTDAIEGGQRYIKYTNDMANLSQNNTQPVNGTATLQAVAQHAALQSRMIEGFINMVATKGVDAGEAYKIVAGECKIGHE